MRGGWDEETIHSQSWPRSRAAWQALISTALPSEAASRTRNSAKVEGVRQNS